jgi:hypothetical protein
LFTVRGLNSTGDRKSGDDSMMSFDQTGPSRKLSYLGASLAVGAALAVAGFVVGTDGTGAVPSEEISPRDAVAAAPPAIEAHAAAPPFAPQIPAELLVPPQSLTVAPTPLPDPPSTLARSDTPGSIPAATSPVPMPKRRPILEARPAEPPRPEMASTQIARIKTALNLTPAQEQYWPPVEAALRDIVTQVAHDSGQSRGLTARRNPASIDPERVQRLTSAAIPLLMTFDEAQKREVRRIARNMGLEDVAAAI